MSATKKTCLASLILAVAFICSCAREPSQPLPPPKEPEKPTVSELKAKVDTLLASGDSVMIRRGIADVFSLVDLMTEAKRQDETIHYLSAALKYNSWALGYQMQYAELLEARGETTVAGERATLVSTYAEKDEQVRRARRLLQKDQLPTIPGIEKIKTNKTTLVLVPVGEVDVCVLDDARIALHDKLCIPVLLQDAHVPVPDFKRDPVKRHLADMRERLQKGIREDIGMAAFLKQKGVTEESLRRDDCVMEAFRQLAYNSGGTNALNQFDTKMRQLKQLPKQWEIEDLLTNLTTSVQPFREPGVYFMGVVNLDTFADQSNFIFGYGEFGGHHAMMSYRRFAADFTGENPNRQRLVKRTLKQVLSSFGSMLGFQRCSIPTCARAYPHNLSEHDAKSTELCDACRAGFEKALGVASKKDREDQP